MVESVAQSRAEIVVDSTEKSKIRVLHVDDDLGLLKVAKQCLEMQGQFQVDTANSVGEALVKLEKEQYAAVVSDYQMPEKDGLEFLKELREKGNMIPFIIFTGKGREEVAVKALNLGANQYLSKTGDPAAVYCELAHGINQASKRREAEEKIRKSETKYRSLVEQSMQGIIIAQGSIPYIVFVNCAMSKILGYTVEELTSLSPQQTTGLVHPDDRELFFGRYTERLEGRPAPPRYEVRGIRKDGTIVWLELSSARIEYDGHPAVQAIFTDITERKKTEQTLKESEKKYRDLVELAPDGIVAVNVEGIITSANRSFLALIDYGSEEEIVGKPFTELMTMRMEDIPKFQEMFKSLMKGESPSPSEFLYVRRDGTSRWAEVHHGLMIKDGHPVGVQAIIVDVTERKNAEKLTQESQQKFEQLFMGNPDAAVYVDPNERVLNVNPRFTELFGYSFDEVKGKFLDDFLAPEDRKQEALLLAQKGREGYLYHETVRRNKKGSLIPVALSSAPIVLQGHHLGDIVLYKDVTERKKAEEALRESEEKFRTFFNQAMDAIFVADAETGTIIDCNQAAMELVGRTKPELIGKHQRILHPGTDTKSEAFSRTFQQHIGEREGQVLETQVITKTGEIKEVAIKGSIVELRGRRVLQGIFRDISEQKRMERKLFDEQMRLQSVFDTTPNAIIVIDLNGKIVDINNQAQRIFGYSSKNDSVGRSAFESIAERDRQRAIDSMEKTLKQGLTRNIEYTIIPKDGSERIISVSASVSKDVSGNPAGFVSVIEDITERKKAERTALEIQQNFKALFAGNPEAAVHVGPDFCVLDVNPMFETLFGYKLDEIKGRNINDVVVPKDKIDEAQMLDYRAEQDKHVSHDTIRRKKDGSLVPVFVSAAPITVEGRFLGYMAVYKDIAGLKNTETKLEMMNEKLRVTGGLTRHDVRNKLSTVTGNVYLLKKRLADNSDVLDKLRDIENAVQQTVRIFDFAKAYELLGVEELSFIDVAKTLDEAVSLFSGPINVNIVNECRGLVVLADLLLRQLFYNLIDNSLRYGQKVSRIRVHYEETGQDNLRLVYEDDGVGILAAEKPKLFKEGYSTGGSTGYGLYLVSRIAEVYGWTIHETGTPGKGAQFTIVIPKVARDGKESVRLS
jgi:PAS domain S-box-containing protein